MKRFTTPRVLLSTLVLSLGLAVGADGLIVEAHPDPLNAFSDAAQQLESGKFQRFLDDLAPWIELARKERGVLPPA